MDEKIESKLEFKERLINFYNHNKKKINILILILITILISFIFLKNKSQKNNILISEKYIKAGLFLTSNKTEEAKKIFEEIILSKNKFYSILSLNTILEKNLETDQNKILDYFTELENKNFSKEKSGLIKLKKALFLIKNNELESGNKLLKDIIEENPSLKPIIKEIVNQ